MKLIDNLIKLTQYEQDGINKNSNESSGEDKLGKSSINFMRIHQNNSKNEDLCDNILFELFNRFDEKTDEDFKIEERLGLIRFQNDSYYLNRNYFIVGRKSKFFNKCDLNIEKSSFVSRIHFIIEFNSLLKKFYIYCVSKNGIFINNRFLQRGIPTQLDNLKCTLRFPNTSIKIYFESLVESSPSHTIKNESIFVEIEPPKLPTPPEIDNNDFKDLKCIKNVIKAFIKTNEKLINNDDVDDNISLKIEKCENFSQQKQDNASIIKITDSNSSVDNNDLTNDNEFDTNDNEEEDSQLSNSSLTKTNTNKLKTIKKPAYSYAQLIAQAIISSNEKQLTLNQIYMFISRSYPYYKINDKGWQNSIRHNLSLNRYFVKVARQQNEPGKGSFWRIDDKCESKVIEQAYQRKRSRSVTSINNDNTSKKISTDSNINEIDTPMSPLSNTTTVPSPPLSLHQLKLENNESDATNISSLNRNTFISNENQQKLIKLLQSDNISTTDTYSKQSQIPQAYLGYLYQVNPQTNEKNNEMDTNQIKNNNSLQSLLNNSTIVLQCNLTQFANLIPNQNDSNIQNLRIIPFNTNTTNTTNTTDLNNNNVCNSSSTTNNNNNNSTKLRYLLNSDILTPINTSNLMNSSDNHNKNGNNNSKRVIESNDEIDENKFDNNENINKKQKLDDSHISISNTGGNDNDLN